MDLTVGQFVYVIRKRISVPAEKAIFIFVNNTLPPTAALMSTVYEQHKDEDGFMYMIYSGENTFGAGEEVQNEHVGKTPEAELADEVELLGQAMDAST